MRDQTSLTMTLRDERQNEAPVIVRANHRHDQHELLPGNPMINASKSPIHNAALEALAAESKAEVDAQMWAHWNRIVQNEGATATATSSSSPRGRASTSTRRDTSSSTCAGRSGLGPATPRGPDRPAAVGLGWQGRRLLPAGEVHHDRPAGH